MVLPASCLPPAQPSVPAGAAFCGLARWHRRELRPNVPLVEAAFPGLHVPSEAAVAPRPLPLSVCLPGQGPEPCPSAKLSKVAWKWSITGVGPLVSRLQLPPDHQRLALWCDRSTGRVFVAVPGPSDGPDEEGDGGGGCGLRDAERVAEAADGSGAGVGPAAAPASEELAAALEGRCEPEAGPEAQAATAAEAGCVGDPRCSKALTRSDLERMTVPMVMVKEGGVFHAAAQSIQGSSMRLRFLYGTDEEEQWVELDISARKDRTAQRVNGFSRLTGPLGLAEGDWVLFRPHAGADPTHFDAEGWRTGPGGGWQKLSPGAEATQSPPVQLGQPDTPSSNAADSGDGNPAVSDLLQPSAEASAGCSKARQPTGTSTLGSLRQPSAAPLQRQLSSSAAVLNPVLSAAPAVRAGVPVTAGRQQGMPSQPRPPPVPETSGSAAGGRKDVGAGASGLAGKREIECLGDQPLSKRRKARQQTPARPGMVPGPAPVPRRMLPTPPTAPTAPAPVLASGADGGSSAPASVSAPQGPAEPRERGAGPAHGAAKPQRGTCPVWRFASIAAARRAEEGAGATAGPPKVTGTQSPAPSKQQRRSSCALRLPSPSRALGHGGGVGELAPSAHGEVSAEPGQLQGPVKVEQEHTLAGPTAISPPGPHQARAFTVAVQVSAKMLRGGYLRVHSAFATDAGLVPPGALQRMGADAPLAPGLSVPLRLRDLDSRAGSLGSGADGSVVATLTAAPSKSGGKLLWGLEGLGGWMAARGVAGEGAQVRIAFQPPREFTISLVEPTAGPEPTPEAGVPPEVAPSPAPEQPPPRPAVPSSPQLSAPAEAARSPPPVKAEMVPTSPDAPPDRWPAKAAHNAVAGVGKAAALQPGTRTATRAFAMCKRLAAAKQPPATGPAACSRPSSPLTADKATHSRQFFSAQLSPAANRSVLQTPATPAGESPSSGVPSEVRIPVTDTTLGRFSRASVSQLTVESFFGVGGARQAAAAASVPLHVQQHESHAHVAFGAAELLQNVRLVPYLSRAGTSACWRLTGVKRWLQALGAQAGDHMVWSLGATGPGAAEGRRRFVVRLERTEQPVSAAQPGAAGNGESVLASDRTPSNARIPASSVSHLHGYLPPGVPLPPLQPGELRLCGLTFHPDLAPSVRRAMQEWEASSAGGGCGLARCDPSTRQISIPGVDSNAGGSEAAALAASIASTAFSRHGLRRPILATRLARHLGIYTLWDAPLPSGPLPLSPDLVAPGPDPARGGAGLFARAAIKPSWVLGVVGGYVMPRAAADTFAVRGLRQSEQLQAAVLERTDGNAEDADSAWGFLAGSFRLRLPGLGPSPCGADGCELSMLGYGNEAALVNDPRRNPGAWAPGNDVGDEEGAAARANCMVLPVSVRGLVLSVLVALRDIAPGEQLLRDYGAEWWRQLADLWEEQDEEPAAAEEPQPPAAPVPQP